MTLKETIAVAKRRRPKRETRYQRILRLIEDGGCGLLPLNFSCPCGVYRRYLVLRRLPRRCPKGGGPEHPHPDHPGKVGFLTCSGCQHNTDLYLNNRVCTHPQARQVAARWLADAIRAWEERQAEQQQLRLC